ncbi:MAG: carbohydrate ABC transporter permease [Fimbriimonadaceae bacterium]
MTPTLAHAIGTLAFWVAVAAGLRGLWLAGRHYADRNRVGAPNLLPGLLASIVVTLVALGLYGAMRPLAGLTGGPLLVLPLVWPVLPVQGWLAALAGLMGAVRLVQAVIPPRPDEGRAKFASALIWLAFAALFVYLAQGSRTDPTLLRGTIALDATGAAVLSLAAVGSVLAMALTARAVAARMKLAMFARQLALISGSIVFSIPLVWLVITSFKEDRDMASPTGIVWVPRVTEEVPYFDPRDPLFETEHMGRRVQVNVIDEEPDGRLRVNIIRPAAIGGINFVTDRSALREIPKRVPVVTAKIDGVPVVGKVVEELRDGQRRIQVLEPESMQGRTAVFLPGDVEPVRHIGLRWRNYPDALEFLPPETNMGLAYVQNTLFLVVMNVVGTLLSSALVAYAFARLRFPGRNVLFTILLSTMMLPGAVTLLPQFLIFRELGWIDTLNPLWVPAFFASAFNIFLLRQFFMQIPYELEDAAKIDGCSYLKTFWSILMPQIKPALAVIAIWTFMGAWNNFMGPLIYINSPEKMPIAYAVQLFQGERAGEPGLLMAFVTMSMVPVLALFAFAQRYFIEGVTLSGLGGR